MSLKLLWILGFICSLNWASKRTYGDENDRNLVRKQPRSDFLLNNVDLEVLFYDSCLFGTFQSFELLYNRHEHYFNADSPSRLALRHKCILEAIHKTNMTLTSFLLQTKIDVIPFGFIFTAVATNNSNMLRLILGTGKPVHDDMLGFTVDETVRLSIENNNTDMIKLLRTIRPFISSPETALKASRSTRPAVLNCILKYIEPEHKEETMKKALFCCQWPTTTCHIRLILSSLETLPDIYPPTPHFRLLSIEIFKLISSPLTVNPSSVTALIEVHYTIRTPLFTMALKTALGFGKVEIVIGLIEWNSKRPPPLNLLFLSSELLSVASLTGAWSTIYDSRVEPILYTSHFLHFVDESLDYHELDIFMAALDKAPIALKQAWNLSGPVRNRGNAIYQILTEVANGNIKALIRFMTAHPFELGIIWYAWENIFNPSRSDLFLHLANCAAHGFECT